MDDELQLLYSPSRWNKRLSPEQVVVEHGNFFQAKSEAARASLYHFTFKLEEAEANSSKDNEDAYTIDFYAKNSESFRAPTRDDGKKLAFNGRKVFVYIHGGYWQWGSIAMSGFMAENFTAKDVIVAAIGHGLGPTTSMESIVEQCERAVAKILEFGATSSGVYLCGHSAGGHLCAMILHSMLSTHQADSLAALRGIVSVSGVFDLTPLIHTDVNDNLSMSWEEARHLSPLFKKTTLRLSNQIAARISISIIYAENDSPAFKRQSEQYAQVCELN